MPGWRRKIRDAIDQAYSQSAYPFQTDPLRVQIVWFTDRLEDETGPDLDNITKPFLDGLQGTIVADDRIFHEIHLRKVDLNHQFDPEPPLIFEAKAGGATEFVYVRVERLERDMSTKLGRLNEALR